jgi:hypothetical protein
LFDDSVEPQEKYKSWSDALAALLDPANKGTLEFKLSQKLYDRDYPGHFCRQIISVGVSLPVTVGPYQDVRAILTQTGSYTLTKPTIDSVKHLHEGSGTATPDIKINVRSSQQIGLSRGMDDAGVVAMASDDGRYLPFEGTGAVSKWSLIFPRYPADPQQKALLNSLTDIILHVSYMAKDGGFAFAERVESLLNPPPTP